MPLHRRTFTAFATSLLALPAFAAGLRRLGSPLPFDYGILKDRARQLATQPHQVFKDALPPEVAALDWDQYQAIKFRADHALWVDDKLRFQAQLFHLGLFFKRPVHVFEVVDGKTQELAYDPAMFDYGRSGLDGAKQRPDLGFAGFRLSFHTAPKTDIAAFLGASYFRAVSGSRQYGLSARGLAIDTGLSRAEEFPDFTQFYLERPAADSNTVIVYALLDSPSTTGAYRFAITPGDTLVMDVEVALYPRQPIERLGIAPLTSMYQTGENDRRRANDWRPELHDSDGLAMLRSNGEWIWRPLTNPAQLRFNAFADENPPGFGLLQRDRNFDNYQDDGVFYDLRPSLWVEPKGNWGKGAIHLIEIPTDDETFDNIVAYWNPAEPVKPGEELLLGYRLYWGPKPPIEPTLAQVVATRVGLGGVIGQPRREYSVRFAVDFAGGDLSLVDGDLKVEPVISASRGRIAIPSARRLDAIRGRRAMFDLVPDESTEPITLRLYLSAGGQALSETWLYEWTPPPLAERRLY